MIIIEPSARCEDDKTTFIHESELLCLSDIGVEALPLSDNERPFPPEYYTRRFGYKGATTKEGTYEYRNDLIFYSHADNKFRPCRLFVKDIKVTTQKITFIVKNGDPIIVEDKNLSRHIQTDDETYLPNKYESFFGKESILKQHSDYLLCLKGNYGWLNEVDVYSTKIITECIHDGVTSFIIHDFGKLEGGFEIVESCKKNNDISKYDNYYSSTNDSDDSGCKMEETIIDDDDIPF